MNRLIGEADIDFSSVGGAILKSAVLVDVDDDGRPGKAEIALPSAIAPNVINARPSNVGFLNGQKIRIILNGLTESEATIAIGFGLTFADDGTPLLQVRLRDMLTTPLTKAPAPHHWEFKLTNYRIGVGDARTDTPPSPHLAHIPGATGGFKVNRIDFTAAGRPWMLIDELMGTEEHKNKKRVREAVLSGTLSTPYAKGDDWEAVGQVADDISRLLSFALCTWVGWARCSLVSDAGRPTWRYDRDLAQAPYSSITPQIDQYDGGVVRGFLEQAYPRFVEQRDFLDHMLGVYVEARVTQSLLVRTALLSILLDALQDRIHADGHNPQIDVHLDARLDDRAFRDELHSLLSKLSPNWNKGRTGEIVSEIKKRNKQPGYGKAVRGAFESLGIVGFDTLDLGARHKLLHQAVLVHKGEAALTHLFELDYLVFLMLARLLGYSGLFVHQHTGPEPLRVSEVVGIIDDNEISTPAH